MKYLIWALVVIVVVFVVGLVSMYSKISRYSAYWNQRASQSSEENALVYVALGDSTAQGVGASKAEKGYVGLVANALEDKHKRPVHVINLSVSGAKLADVVNEQLPSLTQLQADVVTIEAGANDMADFDETAFRNNMETLMSQAPKHTVISDMPYFGGGRKRNLEVNVLAANKIIHELGGKHGLRVAPLHQVTKERDNIFTMAIDFLHPSDQGYKNWFAAFWQILQK